MMTAHKGAQRPEANVTTVFGPDGAGKSLAVRLWAEQEPSLVVLSGTNMRQWFLDYGDILPLYGITADNIPQNSDVLGKMALVNKAALRLGKSGLAVVIDGHPAHKTAINLAAGLRSAHSTAKGQSLRFGAPIDEQVQNRPLSLHFDILSSSPDVAVAHVEVNTPPHVAQHKAAAELQRRIEPRRTKRYPINAHESLAQMTAAEGLTKVLQARGADVISIWTRPNEIELLKRQP